MINRRGFLKGLAVTTFCISGVLAGATVDKVTPQVLKVTTTGSLNTGDYFTIEGITSKFSTRSVDGLQVFKVDAVRDGELTILPACITVS